MGTYWDMFVEQYADILADKSLKTILEAYFNSVQGDDDACEKIMRG